MNVENLLNQTIRRVITSAILVILAGTAIAQPNLRIMGPSLPEGGYATTARAMQKALTASGAARKVDVYYVTGAGASSVGLIQFVREAKGDPAHLMISGYAQIGAVLIHHAPVSLKDVTPIARLTTETPAIAVPAASPLKNAKDFVALLKAQPATTIWAVGSNGGIGHMAAVMFALTNGIDPATVQYKFFGANNMLETILDGKAAAGLLFNYPTYEKEIRAGRIRIIGITSAERKPGIDCPTLKEQGMDMVFENWRGIVAAPGITASQRKAVIAEVEKAVKSPAWKEILRDEGWDDAYLSGAEFEAFVRAEESRVERVFRALGMIK